MTTAKQKPYPPFKVAIFLLLICNTAIYFTFPTISRGLESVAWLILLALFELEAEFGRLQKVEFLKPALPVVRLVAILSVAMATIAYVYEGDWLDVINSVLWWGVIVLLEWEIRFRELVVSRRRGFLLAATLLYGGLAMLALVWALQGDWLDAYDAGLWLVAFATIEMDLLGVSTIRGQERGP